MNAPAGPGQDGAVRIAAAMATRIADRDPAPGRARRPNHAGAPTMVSDMAIIAQPIGPPAQKVYGLRIRCRGLCP